MLHRQRGSRSVRGAIPHRDKVAGFGRFKGPHISIDLVMAGRSGAPEVGDELAAGLVGWGGWIRTVPTRPYDPRRLPGRGDPDSKVEGL